MKRALLPLAAVILGVSGCGPETSASGASPIPSPVETTTAASAAPTPQFLTIEEEGKSYLEAICPLNKSKQAANDVVEQSYDSTAGGNLAALLDLDAAQEASAAARDYGRVMVEQLVAEEESWTGRPKKTMLEFTDEYFVEISHFNSLADSTSSDEFLATWSNWPDTERLGVLSQKLRQQLGLPADASASCGL
jgi:hypothetical protein